MPHILDIQLTNFKNLQDAQLSFCTGLNVIAGPNGSGKTNLLDAIYMLCFTKSAFPLTEQQIIQNGGADYYALEGHFEDEVEAALQIRLAYQKGRGKVAQRNGQDYERLRDHIGRLPVVFLSPSDTDYIRGAAELRRRFMDSLIAQFDGAYMDALYSYNQALSSRNKVLKQAEHRQPDPIVLEAYEQQMAQSGRVIFERRQHFTEIYAPLVKQYYTELCQGKETVLIDYRSSLHQQPLAQLLKDKRSKDLALQYTSVGTHRDDWKFKLKDHSLRKLGSQGQQKSFAIALQLARRDLLEKELHKPPLLLLDDIFSKLDQARAESLLGVLSPGGYQIFLTDARPKEARVLMAHFQGEQELFHLSEGAFHTEEK